MSSEPKCPHCGSEYVDYEGYVNGAKTYKCLNCKESFQINTNSKKPNLIRIATFYGSNLYHVGASIDLYKDEQGKFLTTFNCSEKKYRTPKIKVISIPRSNKKEYYITISTGRFYNDEIFNDGKVIRVKEIQLNEELTAKALEHKAMKITHSLTSFNFSQINNYKLLSDVVNWLNSVVLELPAKHR